MYLSILQAQIRSSKVIYDDRILKTHSRYSVLHNFSRVQLLKSFSEIYVQKRFMIDESLLMAQLTTFSKWKQNERKQICQSQVACCFFSIN